MSFYMDDYFQEFSEYLVDNYAQELIDNDVEGIYKKLMDRNNEKKITYDLNDLFKQTDYHYSYSLQVFFFYYLLYILGPKNVKLKWFKSSHGGRVSEYVDFQVPIQFECRNVYDLDESNFDGITDVDFGEVNFIRNIKLPSTIQHFEINGNWDNRGYNILDLSKISNEFFINARRDWYELPLCFSMKGISVRSSCITKVILPPNLEVIPNDFFGYCKKLKEITLPESLIKISSMAFEGCKSLQEINYLGTKEQWKQVARSSSWRRSSAIKIINCSDGIIKLG